MTSANSPLTPSLIKRGKSFHGRTGSVQEVQEMCLLLGVWGCPPIFQCPPEYGGPTGGLDKNITIQLDCMTQGTEKYPARIFFKFLLKKHKILKISFLTNLRPYDMLYQINEVVYR